MRGKYEMRRMKKKLAETEDQIAVQKERHSSLLRTIMSMGMEVERRRAATGEDEPQFATVWHEGTKSFYHAMLIRQMTPAEVEAETRAAAGEVADDREPEAHTV